MLSPLLANPVPSKLRYRSWILVRFGGYKRADLYRVVNITTLGDKRCIFDNPKLLMRLRNKRLREVRLDYFLIQGRGVILISSH